MPASLYTHVIETDGIKRRGKQRVRVRKPRHEVGLPCHCDDCLYPTTEAVEEV